jgi:hypothetical protein
MPIRWYHKLWWWLVLAVIGFDMRLEGPISLEEQNRIEREMRAGWPKTVILWVASLGIFLALWQWGQP